MKNHHHSGGKNITPSEIENQLKSRPMSRSGGDRRQAAVPHLSGHDRQETVEKFAQDHDIPFTNYASLCRAAEIQDLIQREIETVTSIRAGRNHQEILPDRASADARGQELTADHEAEAQLREKALRDRINAMYGERAVA